MKIRHFAIPVASLALVMITANLAYAAHSGLADTRRCEGWAR
jgi:hypothetical protein